MSAISSIAGAAQQAATSASAAAGRNPFGEVSREEWLGIILEELSNQDPFEPNDTAATLEQLNSLRSIESDISLQGQLESLVLQNSIGQAGALIGKEIEGLSTAGDPVTGVVSSVRVIEGVSQLQLESGASVTFENVTDVRQPGAASTQPDAGDTTALATPAAASANPAASAAAATAAASTPDVDDVLAGLISQLNDATGGVSVVDTEADAS